MEIKHVQSPSPFWLHDYTVTARNGDCLKIDQLKGKVFEIVDQHDYTFSVYCFYFAGAYHGHNVLHTSKNITCPYCHKHVDDVFTDCSFYNQNRTHSLLSILLEHPSIRLHNVLEFDMKVSETPLWECLIASLET